MKIEKIDKWLDDKYGISYTELVKIKDYLVDENERLSEIIDKAIKFIIDNAVYKKITVNQQVYYNEYIINQALDILRGKDNE